ncbi:UDP-N-acetylenolpyruvoylglucosamine reductase [hydrothermal vent metagenome]|uniref:UDP-N-acetylmuramate dehydrogenase n=1 Tax=hydrothermal vent metagenome TaxID=652676 RepID=A0A3B0Y8W2_9ZZZZ
MIDKNATESVARLALGDRNLGVVRTDEPLRLHSNWKIGGPADVFIEPENEEQIANAICVANENDIPLVVIGDGTNLLFDDKGVRGIVLNLGRSFGRHTIERNVVKAEAGIWVPRLARITASSGLAGLEHIVGIPGTLGGLVWMNGGSLRKGIGENVISVSAIDMKGNTNVLTNEECGFSYRGSAFQKMKAIIVGVELELKPGNQREIKSSMLKILRSRSSKFPRKLPNCGSVFMSVSDLYEQYGPPGKIIEDLGFKGRRIGDAQVSKVHANFILNRGNASSVDMLELIKQIRLSVYKKTNMWINCEVHYVHPAGKIEPAHMALAP